MKQAVIRSTWMDGYGYRLDCSPYLGGALETKVLLEKLPLRKDPLHTLTAGFDGGIYNGPQFVRHYVESKVLGVPFMTGSSMLLADLSNLARLSKRDAHGPKLRHLEVQPGMSLISCSGTIGKMAYARREMAGAWSSQDILKVVADPAKIPSGYLYAYLSSKFGVPLVVSGTYGAIIQHLEPEHIAGLPVPRVGDALEHEIHSHIEEAAALRTRATARKYDAIGAFVRLCGLPELKPANKYPSPQLGTATTANLAERMDSTYYIALCVEARAAFDDAGRRSQSKALSEVAEVFIPTIFKRQYASDPEHGYPYITGADVFCINPTSTQYLMRSVAHRHRLVLRNGMIVLHEAGQRYGLIGHGVMVGQTLDGFACTNNMVRLVPFDAEEAGFIFAALSSEHGVRLVKREAAGSSIPHLDQGRIAGVKIPWPEKKIRREIAAIAHEARECWDKADDLENQADAKLVKALVQKAESEE
jgi:type I restriction enzyme S subunit